MMIVKKVCGIKISLCGADKNASRRALNLKKLAGMKCLCMLSAFNWYKKQIVYLLFPLLIYN